MQNDPAWHSAIVATAMALKDYDPKALRAAASSIMDEIFSIPLATTVSAQNPRLGQAKERLRIALAGSDEAALRHAAEFFCWALRESAQDRVPVIWSSIDDRRLPDIDGFEVTIPIDDPKDIASIVWTLESFQDCSGVRNVVVMDDHNVPHFSVNFDNEQKAREWAKAHGWSE